jgi:hypothetical protein
MSTTTVMTNTDGQYRATSLPVQANGWYSFTDGLHTVSIQTQNFTGRVYLEGSLATDPQDTDWFTIPLGGLDYAEFPQRKGDPSGMLGDTGTVAFSFRANIMWVRARMERSYFMPDEPTLDQLGKYGVINKIILSR